MIAIHGLLELWNWTCVEGFCLEVKCNLPTTDCNHRLKFATNLFWCAAHSSTRVYLTSNSNLKLSSSHSLFVSVERIWTPSIPTLFNVCRVPPRFIPAMLKWEWFNKCSLISAAENQRFIRRRFLSTAPLSDKPWKTNSGSRPSWGLVCPSLQTLAYSRTRSVAYVTRRDITCGTHLR